MKSNKKKTRVLKVFEMEFGTEYLMNGDIVGKMRLAMELEKLTPTTIEVDDAGFVSARFRFDKPIHIRCEEDEQVFWDIYYRLCDHMADLGCESDYANYSHSRYDEFGNRAYWQLPFGMMKNFKEGCALLLKFEAEQKKKEQCSII